MINEYSGIPAPEDPQVLEAVAKWLSESGEVYVVTDSSHTGHSGFKWFVRSMADYQNLIRSRRNGADITVYRKKRYPLRGVAGDALLVEALALIKEGDWYDIVSIDGFPKDISYYGSGNSHEELRQDMEESRGTTVGVGHDVDSMIDWLKEEMIVVRKPTAYQADEPNADTTPRRLS